jgi:hypothetical protein
MKHKIIIPISISLLSCWLWYILGHSLIIGILVTILSLTFYNKKIYISYLLLFLISALIFRQVYDKNIFLTSILENDGLEKEEVFFSKDFGKLYKNRIGIYLHKSVGLPIFKLQKNLFYNLDPNQYFFAGHPRERANAVEFEKFSFIFLPFFIIGLYFLVSEPIISIIFFVMVTTFMSVFVNPGYILGPVLFFPILVYLISLGLEKTILWLKNIYR